MKIYKIYRKLRKATRDNVTSFRTEKLLMFAEVLLKGVHTSNCLLFAFIRMVKELEEKVLNKSCS